MWVCFRTAITDLTKKKSDWEKKKEGIEVALSPWSLKYNWRLNVNNSTDLFHFPERNRSQRPYTAYMLHMRRNNVAASHCHQQNEAYWALRPFPSVLGCSSEIKEGVSIAFDEPFCQSQWPLLRKSLRELMCASGQLDNFSPEFYSWGPTEELESNASGRGL